MNPWSLGDSSLGFDESGLPHHRGELEGPGPFFAAPPPRYEAGQFTDFLGVPHSSHGSLVHNHNNLTRDTSSSPSSFVTNSRYVSSPLSAPLHNVPFPAQQPLAYMEGSSSMFSPSVGFYENHHHHQAVAHEVTGFQSADHGLGSGCIREPVGLQLQQEDHSQNMLRFPHQLIDNNNAPNNDVCFNYTPPTHGVSRSWELELSGVSTLTSSRSDGQAESLHPGGRNLLGGFNLPVSKKIEDCATELFNQSQSEPLNAEVISTASTSCSVAAVESGLLALQLREIPPADSSSGDQTLDREGSAHRDDLASKASTSPTEAQDVGEANGQRTSKYRGVTRHRWTRRYEAHLWDNSYKRPGKDRKGRQVYLGGYDNEIAAARAYDLAALKYWGPSTVINFPLSTYADELEDMKNYKTRQLYVAAIRRKSDGFSRGTSKYRGVTRHHQHGRWQARIGRVAGHKDLYLGTFASEVEAAQAYDRAAIKYRGMTAITNFPIEQYINVPSDDESGERSALQEVSNNVQRRELEWTPNVLQLAYGANQPAALAWHGAQPQAPQYSQTTSEQSVVTNPGDTLDVLRSYAAMHNYGLTPDMWQLGYGGHGVPSRQYQTPVFLNGTSHS